MNPAARAAVNMIEIDFSVPGRKAGSRCPWDSNSLAIPR
jgi:hypothetical protein